MMYVRTSSSFELSNFFVNNSVVVYVVVTRDLVVATSVAVVVGVAVRLRVRGTVDIPRLMMVRVFPFNGVKVGASMPN